MEDQLGSGIQRRLADKAPTISRAYVTAHNDAQALERYKGYRYPIEVIRHAVWLYHRFALSLRDEITVAAAA